MEGNEAEILSGIEPYVDPNKLPRKKRSRSLTNSLTPEEVANLVGQGDEILKPLPQTT